MKLSHRHASLPALVFFVLAAGAVAESSRQAEPGYPDAPRTDASDVYHGETVSDPYRWMEDSQDPRLASWLDAQARLTASFFDPRIRQQARKRIAELEDTRQRYAPIKAGKRYFFAEFPSVATDKTGIYVREGRAGVPRLLTEPPYHFGEDVDPGAIRFNGFTPNDDGSTVAYSTSGDGSVWHRVRFLDVDSGRLLDDELRGINRIAAGLAWGREGDRLYYVRFDEPAGAAKMSAPVVNGRIYLHVVGQSQVEDTLVFAPEDDQSVPSVAASLDGRYLVVHVLDPLTQANRVFVRKTSHATAATQELFRGRPARYAYLDNDGPRFWFYTSEDAPNGRVVSIDIATGEETVVIAERDEAMSGGSLVGGNAMGKFGDRFVILYRVDGLPVIRVFDLDGNLTAEVAAPPGGSVWGGFSGRADDPELYFGFIGLTDPFAVYRMDARDGTYHLYSSARPAGLDPDAFTIRQVTYESRDGTRVPMFIAHRKGLAENARHPTYVYGYGAFGWNSFLYYQSHVVAWLEMGGIYAQPALPGGGEFGQQWHDAGKGVNKENTVSDFIAAAEWLIDAGYASPDSLVVNGGSASAMPAAAAMQRRPDLFAAAIIDRPALDMLRFDRFTQGRMWLDEFGSPETRDDYLALRRLSPYHNLEQGACYPATLMLVGESDPVTPPLHGYKYTAAMQHAQGCRSPVLLYVMPKTGHT